MARRSGEYLLEKWRSWLSLNDSWPSKWWYSTVHIVTVTIGAGVLGLPTVMAYFRWELGTILLVGFLVFSQMCYWQLIQMHETKHGNHRFDRYHELGQHILGKSLGFWLIAPLQAISQVGTDIVYIIAGAKSLQHIYKLLQDCKNSSLTLWMIVFTGTQLLLSQLPHFQSITWVSFIAALAAIGYCTFAWVAILIHPPSSSTSPIATCSSELKSECFRHIKHDYPQGSAAHLTFGFSSALGKLAFAASAGHNVALEIQATIPSTRQNPSRRAMWQGLLVAYFVVALCYLPVALVGYRYYGNETRDICSDNVLVRLDKPKFMIVLADLMVFIHLCGSYQVFAMPIFSNMELILEKLRGHGPSFKFRMASRSIFVVCTFLLAAAFPFFGDLQAFFGGLAVVPTTYMIPSILWHLYRKPEVLSPQWIANVLSISLGTAVMLTSTVGGLRSLIVRKRKTFGFFH